MTLKYFIGLPEWRHSQWYSEGANPKNPLQIYSQHFSSAEGNMTFYAPQKRETVEAWRDATPDEFRFCFKFPRAISHDAELRHCAREVTAFFENISPLNSKLGIVWLQMGPSFGPDQLPTLEAFLSSLPEDFTYGIEVRNSGFFQKDEREASFNRLLQAHGVNRVMFDTRPLFKHPADDEATLDCLKKKPRLPNHVVATGDHPMLRFIAPMDYHLADTELDQWAGKVAQWIHEGKKPYLFFHTPDKRHAPELAQWFTEKLAAKAPGIDAMTLWDPQPEQDSLW